MNLQPNAVGDTAAIMAALYIAVVVEPRPGATILEFRQTWVKAVAGLGLFMPAPVLVTDVVLLLGSITLRGTWASLILELNVLAVFTQLFHLLAAWNEASRGPAPARDR